MVTFGVSLFAGMDLGSLTYSLPTIASFSAELGKKNVRACLKCWPSIRELLDSKSTVLRPLFSLVNRPIKTLKQQFKICWVLILVGIMRNILDSLHLWAVKKRKVSPISSSKCGKEFKGGRVSYSIKRVGRY